MRTAVYYNKGGSKNIPAAVTSHQSLKTICYKQWIDSVHILYTN